MKNKIRQSKFNKSSDSTERAIIFSALDFMHSMDQNGFWDDVKLLIQSNEETCSDISKEIIEVLQAWLVDSDGRQEKNIREWIGILENL
ncbi:hypothetical protein [Sporosarcina sp. FSL W7-1283]|uniref:hypothetical protein n=1 Tax=Sporosarcina sp. FSL W7-1283 TaxID=2921560 RepID=UPI0030F95E26